MSECSTFSNRVARLLVGALCAASVAVAVAVVETVTPATPVAAAACPGCVVVSAPTISLSATAWPGTQSVIDQQLGVGVYTPLTTGSPGGPGTMWLVGHRTSYGGVFNRVPFLKAGDPIELINDGGGHQYVVSRLMVVPANGWQNYVNIHDMSRSLLIMQTSHPDSRLRYLIEAFGSLPEPCRAEPLVIGGPALSQATTRFVPIAPQRILDTRTDGAGAMCAGGNIELQITGIAGISAQATAVALTITATGNAAPGFVSVGPAGIDPSSTSSLNLSAAGQSRANLVMVAIGRSGRIAIRVSGSTHVIVDVAGYYEPSASARDGRFVEVTAGRLLDTRTDATQDRVLANETITIDVDARAPQFPAAQASAVVLRVTAANSPTRGYITAWRTGVPRPSTSNVNLSAAGEIASNLAIIPIGPDGAIQVYASTDLDLTIDIVGYFTNATAAVDTAGMFVPVVPRRVLDTRSLPFLLGAGSITTFDLLSPAAIVGPVHLVANVTSTRSLGHGFVALTNSAAPATTGLIVSGGETRANLSITSEASAAMTHVFVSLPTHVVIDVTGYFTA